MLLRKFTLKPVMHNLHTMLSASQFFAYGMLSVTIAAAISYPSDYELTHKASAWIMRNISQEAVLTMFSGLIVVASFYEAGLVGVAITATVGIIGGMLNKYFGVNIGVQFMSIYASSWLMPKLFGIK